MRTVTRAEIVSMARELADEQSSQFVTAAAVNAMLNGSVALWYGLVVRACPERFEKVQSITADGSASYNLPSDHMGTLSVELAISDLQSIDVPRIMFQERNHLSRAPGNRAIGYRLAADKLLLLPPPQSGTYRHVYVPTAPVLTQDSDTVDGVNGWEQLIVYDLAIKMRAKDEAAVTDLERQRDRVELEIEAAISERDMANPQRIVDVRRPFRYLVPGFRDPDFWFGR